MIRDITIGQYYPANSKLHRLDPRVKIMCTLFYLISLFLFKSVLGYAIATVFLAAVIRTSKVPLKFILKGLKPIIMLLMITVVFNLFLTKGGDVLFEAWIFQVTEEGLLDGCLYGGASDLPDYWFVAYDIYNNTECTD